MVKRMRDYTTLHIPNYSIAIDGGNRIARRNLEENETHIFLHHRKAHNSYVCIWYFT